MATQTSRQVHELTPKSTLAGIEDKDHVVLTGFTQRERYGPAVISHKSKLEDGSTEAFAMARGRLGIEGAQLIDNGKGINLKDIYVITKLSPRDFAAYDIFLTEEGVAA